MWYGEVDIWTKRAAISLYSTVGTADFGISIPVGWGEFWDAIDSAGNELRVVDSRGTLLDYTVDNGSGGAFSKANRLGRLMLNNHTVTTNAMTCCWLYYDSSATQGAATGAAATPTQDGYIEMARPGGPYRTGHQPQTPGSTGPLKSFHKTAAETSDLWIRYGGIVGNWTPQYGTSLQEELQYATYTVENTTGTNQSGMVDLQRLRFVWAPSEGGMWIRVPIVGGTSGINYTSSVVARCVSPLTSANILRPIFDTRVGWRVNDTRITS